MAKKKVKKIPLFSETALAITEAATKKQRETPINKTLQFTLAQALNQVIVGTYRALEVDFIDAQGGRHMAHIYRCSADLVRIDFKAKR